MSLTPEERAKHAMSQLGDPRTDDVVLLRSVVHNWLVSVLRLAIAEEREAAAKIAADHFCAEDNRTEQACALAIAAAIRARP